MGLLNDNDMHKILQTSKMGLWRVEFEEGKAPRFFADAMRDELLGISGDVTPEEQNLGNLLRALYYPDQTVGEKLRALRNGNGSVDYECIIGKGTQGQMPCFMAHWCLVQKGGL